MRSPRVPFYCFLFFLSTVHVTQAQTLPQGTWNGFMATPGGEFFETKYRISTEGDSVRAIISVNGWDRDFLLHRVRLRNSILSFYWEPSFLADCKLVPDKHGIYQGACMDPWGNLGPLMMIPPGKPVDQNLFNRELAISPWKSMARRAEMEKVEERIGKPVDIGGHSLNMHVTGTGEPTIILEAGLGDNLRIWDFVQFELEQFARVVSYDRAGLGYSDPTTESRTPVQIARELHSALQQASINPPYVLVGHSFGAVFVRSFAALYPSEVVGLVLIDPDHESLGKRWSAIDQQSWNTYWNQQKELYSLASQPVKAEFELYRQMIEEARAPGIGPLPDVPTAILTALRTPENPRWVGETTAGQQAKFKLHQAWANQTQKAFHQATEESGRYIQREEPEMLIAAVRRVLDGIRSEKADK